MQDKGLSLLRNNAVFLDVLFFFLACFLVHSVYVFYVHPISAEEISGAVLMGAVPKRTVWLILKDLEQELCLILAIWCIFMLFNRYRILSEDSRLIQLDFLGFRAGGYTLASVEGKLAEAEGLGIETYLIPGCRTFLDNFMVSGSVEDSKKIAFEHYELSEEVLESRLQLINFILWAIPSVGFLGTVRGIGQALADADQALAGDIANVALNLGIAFNSTFVALLLSLFLTFIASTLRGRDIDRLIKSKRYISENLAMHFKNLKV